LDRLGHGLGGVLDRAHDLLLQGFQLLRQGGAGLLHLMANHFGFTIHCTFSFRAWAVWPSIFLPTQNRIAPTTTRRRPTRANHDHRAIVGTAQASQYTSPKHSRMIPSTPTPTPKPRATVASLVLRRSSFTSCLKRASCCFINSWASV